MARPRSSKFLEFFIGALKAVAPEFAGIPDDPPPLEFQMPDPEVLRQRLTDAGLRNVRVERTDDPPAFASGQEMWDWVLYGNPIPAMLVADLTESKRARLRQVLDGIGRSEAHEVERLSSARRVHAVCGASAAAYSSAVASDGYVSSVGISSAPLSS
jgi:hypothetical protein